MDADALLRIGRDRKVQALIGVALLVFLLYHLTRFRFAQMWPIAPVGDASILFHASRQVFASGVYPAATFPYSPSAVILFQGAGIGRAGRVHAAVVRGDGGGTGDLRARRADAGARKRSAAPGR